MKKISIVIISSFLTIYSYGQVDSMNLKTGPFILQARDAEYLNSLLGEQDIFQDFLDTVSQKFNDANKPVGTTTIRIDSIKVSTLILVSSAMRGLPYLTSRFTYNRVDAAIRACNNNFLLNYLNTLDKKEDTIYDQLRQRGRRRLIRGL